MREMSFDEIVGRALGSTRGRSMGSFGAIRAIIRNLDQPARIQHDSRDGGTGSSLRGRTRAPVSSWAASIDRCGRTKTRILLRHLAAGWLVKQGTDVLPPTPHAEDAVHAG